MIEIICSDFHEIAKTLHHEKNVIKTHMGEYSLKGIMKDYLSNVLLLIIHDTLLSNMYTNNEK